MSASLGAFRASVSSTRVGFSQLAVESSALESCALESCASSPDLTQDQVQSALTSMAVERVLPSPDEPWVEGTTRKLLQTEELSLPPGRVTSPPLVTLTTPSAGVHLSGRVRLEASATDFTAPMELSPDAPRAVSVTYTLPEGGVQAVRAAFLRRLWEVVDPLPCVSQFDTWEDHDDLVFARGAGG